MEPTDIQSLKANPKNPRQISKFDYDNLVQSIKIFGDLSGIVFNETTEQLVGGHQRVEAFKQLGGQPVVTERLSEPNSVGTVARGHVLLGDEQYAYRIVRWEAAFESAANVAANRIQGDFDKDLLAQLDYNLSQLDNSADLLALTGQDEDELNKMLDSVGALGEGDAAEDEAPAIDEQNPPVSKLGEIYQLGNHRLMCGSSTDFGQVSELLNGIIPELVFTDPPYGIDIITDKHQVGADFGIASKGSYEPVIGDSSIKTAQEFYDCCINMDMKKIILWGGNYFLEFLPVSDGWLVWDKRGDSKIRNSFADGEMAWCNFHTPIRIYTQLWNGMIREGEHDKRVHPTQKPIKTLSSILKDFSERDQVIYDGFGGSGSTLISCEEMGRTCYMMELSPAYCDVIRKRYAKHVGQEADWQTITPIIQEAADAEPEQPQT